MCYTIPKDWGSVLKVFLSLLLLWWISHCYTSTSPVCAFVGSWHSLWGGINRSRMFSYCPAVGPLWHHISLLPNKRWFCNDFDIQIVFNTAHELTLSRASVSAYPKLWRFEHNGTSEVKRMSKLKREGAGQTGSYDVSIKDRMTASLQKNDRMKRIARDSDQSLSPVERPFIKVCLPVSIPADLIRYT